MEKVVCRISREEILRNMKAKVDAGVPIVISGAGVGIVARVLEKAGADMAVVYNSGHFRMNGYSSILGNLPVGDANEIVYQMGLKQILPMAKKMPVAAGVFGVDPTRDMEAFLRSLADIGYSAIINYPTVGKFSGQFRREIESVGLGYAKEADMMKLAHELGFTTLGYVYEPEEAKMLAEAGADILVSHAGLTAGGDVGTSASCTLDEAIEKTERVLRAGLEVNSEIIPLCHGGAIANPEDFARVYKETCCVGFVGASSIERIPVEKALKEAVKGFADVR